MWNSPLLAYRTQKPHPAQTGQSQIPQSCLYQPAWEYTTWGGEWAVVGLCLGRHFQVQSSTFQGRKASPTSDYTFLFASSQIPLFLSSLSLFFFSLIKDMQILLWVTAAVLSFISSQRRWSLRDCLHVPWLTCWIISTPKSWGCVGDNIITSFLQPCVLRQLGNDPTRKHSESVIWSWTFLKLRSTSNL